MPIATIIGGIVAAGAAITGGILSAQSQKEANEMNLGLAELQRQDQLRQQRVANKQAEQSLSLSRRSLDIQKEEAELSREERLEEKGYNRLQNAANRFAEFRNSKVALQQNKLAPLMKG